MHHPVVSLLAACVFLLAGFGAASVQASEPYSPADAEGRAVYLVQFVEPGLVDRHRQRSTGERFSAELPHVQAAQAELMRIQADHLDRMSATLGRMLEPSHYYLASRSGMALRLTEAEARQLVAMPQVASVARERVYELATYRGPTFIGADQIWDGSAVPGGTGYEGRGLIAAILDTGIDDGSDGSPHASFINDPACGHGTTSPNKVLSSLDCATTDGTGLCNGPAPSDSNGHGSHTASTVAGNRVTSGDSPSPTIPGGFTEISGVAPCASIRSYKVCSTNQCGAADIQGGLDSVLLHGDVDSMNYSISGGTNPWNDFDRDKLDIVDSGVFIAASAGNTSISVPNPVGQVNHRGPWVMSVAASTRDTNDSGGAAQGDVLAGFSLRGPTPSPLQDLQKPNITGPGVRIYAAVPNGYAFLSGTSMSSPHVAGAAVLVRQIHPSWTPTEVKSAMQMSSFNGGFIENGTTPWDPDDVGSGRVDLTTAARSGLVMPESTANFLAANPGSGGDVKTLNTPDVRNLSCTPSCSFTRTVRNTLTTATSWTVSGAAFDGDFLIDVSPSSFTFDGGLGETQELTITLAPSTDLTGTIAFGDITFVEDGGLSPDLRITAAVSGVGGPAIGIAPGSMSFTVNEGDSDAAPLTISNTGTQDLNWNITESTPDSLPANARGVAIDEVLSLPDFTVDPANPVAFDVPGGVANTGNVTGFTFQGTVAGVSGNGDWASDMRMVMTAPNSDNFDVGGFDGPVNDWEFQGSGSANDGTYSSSHSGSFASVPDAGDWNFAFEHDWSSGNPMNWSAVTVTLHKEAIICENVTEISWLSVDTTSGVISPSGDQVVSVQVDSTGLAAGIYEAQVCVNSDAANASIIAVPVTLEVIGGGPDAATLTGTVQSLGYCGANPATVSNVEVTVAGQINTVSTFTNGSGVYTLNVSETESPVTISVAPAGHVGDSAPGVSFVANDTVTTDFDLWVTEPCADVSEAPMGIVLPTNGTGSMDLTIGNDNGGADLSWMIETEGVVASDPRGHFPAQSWSGGRSFDPESSMLADPSRAGVSSTAASSFEIAGGLTAYSTTGFTAEGYVSLDPTVPGTLSLINAVQPTNVYAATFIGGDFTTKYAIASSGGDLAESEFGTIDVATGAFTSIGSITGAGTGTWTSMKYDYTTDTLYAVQVPAPGTNNLYTIDAGTQTANLVGTIPGDIVISIAIDLNGQMYGLDLTPDALLAIDKTDATAASIGPTGLAANFAQDMDFDYATNTLYWAAYLGSGDSRMTTVDTSTGAATVIGNIANGNELLSFDIANPGVPPVCANPGVVPWLSATPASGNAPAFGSETASIDFDSTGLAVGTYEAHLCVTTGDANNPAMVIPVSMQVTNATDEIFDDRFEQ
ncbi:S8 family serine peptidase [Wenzhouxiangella marina]|uniref:Uncharacterized protein n=1 Tax=Wenzhouxiangella marina TaxID=1579979 RepID=A0A0K0Y081_9GAMM|nr:S8 family serine peptidase [Wenzhouxiangella marina]AKS43325.1 hypothetical protein WM2015_2972 [Wenzhouxiangella marina]MBB6088560.1 subtilisin family serine protease [Wenzhouxiangella marina]